MNVETAVDRGRAWSWQAPGTPGIQCFRAAAMIHRYGRHSHDSWAIGVFDAGAGGTEYRGASFKVPTGGIVVMDPDEPHTGYAADDVPMSYRMLYVGVDAFRSLLPDRSDLPHFRDMIIHDAASAARIASLHDLLGSQTADLLEQQSTTHIVLSEFAQQWAGTRPAIDVGREPEAVRIAKEWIAAHYAEHVRLDELAAAVALHPSYLIRVFRRATGIAPYQWLLQVRVERAKALLAAGESGANVAQAVGFADQSLLTRHFRSLTGMSPGRWARGQSERRRPAGWPGGVSPPTPVAARDAATTAGEDAGAPMREGQDRTRLRRAPGPS